MGFEQKSGRGPSVWRPRPFPLHRNSAHFVWVDRLRFDDLRRQQLDAMKTGGWIQRLWAKIFGNYVDD